MRLPGLITAFVLCLPVPTLAKDLALLEVGPQAVRWEVQGGDFETLVLTVALPDGQVTRREIPGGQPVVFALDGAPQDGSYAYELRGVPRIDPSVRQELATARGAGTEEAVIERLQEAGKLPREEAVQSGAFLVMDGAIVPREPEEREPLRRTAGSGIGIITAEDQVIPDDLIVQGSQCVGLSCINNEVFNFDTIRLKENNLRIHFDDISSTGGFPANDWRLIANDSASGGFSKFSIEDATAARTPFTILAGASNNSIFVDSQGQVGLRTSTPTLDLHINTSNTPAIRLEQNSSGGFTAQTWDIGANEASFFVRDTTSGLRMPLRVRRGAPTSSLDISGDGDVGIGTGSPSTRLHVLGSGAGSTDGKVLIENTSATSTSRELLELKGLGGVALILDDTNDASRWTTSNVASQYLINNQGNPGFELAISATGNVTTTGTVNGVSDRNAKKDVVPVRREEILAKLAALPISTWSYKTEDIRHMGPMAQDFSAAFGLGEDDRHIAMTDMAGVTMAAVQALHDEIAELKERLARLEKLIDQGSAEK